MNKLVLGMLLASSSFTVMAAESEPSTNWVGGISYINLSDEDEGLDISLGGVVGSFGYKIKSGDNFYLTPEVRIGVGIKDDTIFYSGIGFDVELDRFLALSVRGQFELDNGVYIFVAPTYANAKFTVSASHGYSGASSTDSWELGVGGGVGYNFSNTTSAEGTFEQFDGTDVFSLGLKFNF